MKRYSKGIQQISGFIPPECLPHFGFFALTVMLYLSQGSSLSSNLRCTRAVLLEAFHTIYSTSLCRLLVAVLLITIVVVDPYY